MTSAEDALAAGLAIVEDAPDHKDHRHAIAIGVVMEEDGIAIVAAVQGLGVPVWVTLDEDDLARLQAWTSPAFGPVQ